MTTIRWAGARTPLRVLAGGCALVVLAGVASCSRDEPEPVATPSPTVTASPTPEPEPTTLLSGRPGKDGPVLAVKLDNTGNARPHSGLMAADVVYLEEVEFGLTRYLAVYSSRLPKEIGPIRSARIGDLELLEQYGRVGFAFSGAQRLMLPLIDAAPLYPISFDASSAGYWRQSGRYAPYDVFGDPKALLDRAPKAQRPRDVGFRFAEAVPPGGKRVRSVTAGWPNATANFRWSKQEERWLLTMDGVPAPSVEGPQLGGTTVIIQSLDVYPSRFGDSFGGVTPMIESVGRGKALVLRDGRMWRVTWVRKSADTGTRWLYRGKNLELAPGQVWIALLDDDRRPTIG